MKKLSFLRLLLVGMLLIGSSSALHAGSPIWTFTPLTATTLTLEGNNTAIVQYLVTMQGHKTHSLMMKPVTAITQLTAGLSVCPNPFVLGYQQSCVLSLQINGSQLQNAITQGPVICVANANNTPNPNQCYQPSQANQLNVTHTQAPGTATLSASVSQLALSVNCPVSGASCTYSNAALTGTPRVIMITNTSSTTTARNVAYSSSFLPVGTTIAPADCTLAPGQSCTFTITPGETPSAAPGDTNPTPIALTIAGSNTNTLVIDVDILTYGSVHESGYVFAIDDSTPNTSSIAGKVAALADQSVASPWNDQCPSSPGGCLVTTANSFLSGSDNTAAISSVFTGAAIPPSSYAAGLCTSLSTGGNTWYLPAICEMGYGDGSDPFYPCGSSSNPTLQNMQSNLADNGLGDLINSYWSSTQFLSDQLSEAYFNIFSVAGFQAGDFKETFYYVRCVKIF